MKVEKSLKEESPTPQPLAKVGPIPNTFYISLIRKLVSGQREAHKAKAYLLERANRNKVSLHYKS